MERERSPMEGLFQNLISDMKGSFPIWDELVSKASKLQTQLRATVGAVTAFLDAFQRVADLASSSRGGTRDIGTALSRMCLRHRNIETKLRHFSIVFVEGLVNPLQEQMEDWKRSAHCLDKDHAKEYKKARQELKKRSSDSLKLKKTKKVQQVDRISERVHVLEELEKNAVRRALLEERGRFCGLVSLLRPLMDEEMTLLSEISHLQTLSEDLRILTMDPHKLPPSSEQVLVDLKSSESSWSFQTPPTSPTSPSATMSRKSSMSSSVNSMSSGDSSDSPHFRFRSGLVQPGSVRLSSVSSHDSGFNSQDHSARSPSSTTIWDHSPLQPGGVAAKRTRERNSYQSDDLTLGEESKSGRHHVTPTKERDPREELVQALTKGLNLDFQGSYRDSAYSSQNHTPSCSEDHTGSEGDNFSVSADSEAEPHTPTDSSHLSHPSLPHFTLSHPSLSSRRVLPPKCASSVPTPGVATIRRAPSSKASLRRSSLGLNLGPVTIRPPMIPVKTPTVPQREPVTDLPTPPPPQPATARGHAHQRQHRQLPQLKEEKDYLTLIRRGVKLKKTTGVNDRSAPRIQ